MKILYVEDEIAHVELTQRTLEDNFQNTFVLYHEESVQGALALIRSNPEIDIVLTDLRLPDGSGLDLLYKIRELPFPPAVVLVTGQGDQDVAVKALKAGAADYLVKQSDYLHRLPIVISNAIVQNQLAREQAALRAAEQRFRILVEQMPAAVYTDKADEFSSAIYISPHIEDIVGYKAEEWTKDPQFWTERIFPEDREKVLEELRITHSTFRDFNLDYRFIHQDGHIVWVRDVAKLIFGADGMPAYWQGILYNITDEKKNEAALQRQLNEMSVLQAATVAATEGFSEDEIIRRVTEIIGRIYSEVCGLLMLSEDESTLTPHSSYIGANISGWQNGYPISEGITGRAVTDGKVIRLGNITDDAQYIEIASHIRSELCVPVRVSKKVIGVINVESRIRDAFNENDERLLETISSSLGTALERLRLFNEEQRRSRELDTLYQTTKLITQSLEPQTVAEDLITILEKFLGYEYCFVGMLDEKNQVLLPLAMSHKDKDLQAKIRQGIRLDKGIFGWVAQNGLPIRSGAVENDPHYVEAIAGIHSELCVPLISRGKTIGILDIETSRSNAYTEKDQNLLMALASSAAIALENARLYESESARRRVAETLREETIHLTSSVEYDELFDIILQSLEKLIPSDSASIELLEQGQIEIVAGHGIPASLIGKKYITDVSKWGDDVVRNPVIIQDVQQDSRFEKFSETSFIRGWLGVPLLTQGKLIGFLNLDSCTPGFFTEEHASVAQTFGNQAAIAIEKARLFREQNRRSKIIETLAEIANEIATTREVIPALEKIAQRTLEMLKANNVAIYLLQDDNVTLKPVTAHGTYREEMLSHVRKIGEGVTGNVFLNGVPEIINDMQQDQRIVIVPGTSADDSKFDTLMSCPLILRGKPIGVINAWRLVQDGLFNETELNFLVSIANQASICIESGRLFQETKRQAQEADAIAEVGRSISSTLQLKSVLERIASYAKELLNAELSAVYLHDEKSLSLTAIAAIGVDAEEIKQDPLPLGTGILGNIALQKFGEFVNNTKNDPRTVTVKGTEQLPNEHIMGIPILFSENLTGLLAVWRTGKGLEFDAVELEFTSRLAQQAAIAIENARLYEAELKRREQTETLREVTSQLSTTLDIQVLYQIVLDSLSQLIPYDTASIFLRRGTDSMEITAAKGFADPSKLLGKIFSRSAKWTELILERRVLILRDAQADPRFEKWEESHHIHGWMGVPMISQDQVVGFINLDSRKVDAFTERDATLAQTFANSAAVAIQNAKLFETQHEQFKREATILSVMRTAAASLDLDQVLYTILHQLTKLVKAGAGSIQLLEKDQLRIATAIGFDPSIFTENGSIPVNLFPINEYAITKQEAVLIDDVTKDNRYIRIEGYDTARSFLLIPLVSQGKCIGLITLDHPTPGFFTYRDVELGVAIADNASIAITNARLYQEALRATDRRAVLHRISQEIIRFTQDKEQVYSAIHEAAGKLMKCDVFIIALQDQKTTEINFAYLVEAGHRYPAKKAMPSNGLTKQVLSEGRSIIWLDAEQIHIHNAEHFGAPVHVQSVIGVPMKSGERTIGIISAQSYDAYAYGSEEQALLEMLATHAVTAIENTRLYDETQRRLKELEVINRVSTSLRQAQSSNEILNILLSESLSLLDTANGAVWLYDHSLNLLKQHIASGASTKATHKNLMPEDGIIGHVFKSGEKYIASHLKQDILIYPGNVDSTPEGQSGIFIPIKSTIGTMGVLFISIEVERNVSEDVNLLAILAEVAGNAMQRAELFDQSQRQVRRLTTLRDIDAAIASSFDLRLTLNILMDQTLSHLAVDAVDIVLYYPDIQSLTYLVGSGFRTTSPTRPQMRIGEGLAGQVIMRQQTLQVNDLQNAPETRNEILIKREGFAAYIGIPLIIKGQIKGVFEIFNRSGLSPTPDWMDFLHTLAGQAAIAIDNSHLFENLQRSNQELMQAYDTTLEGWARALELRDEETEGHTRRVTELTIRLAKYMGIKDSDLVNIRRGVLLHDIGKMGVPDEILRKPGPLTDKEWVEMRKHPVAAYNLLSPIEYLRDALDIPYCHHEHWDGSGYPRGLKGTQIPLAARIFSIVDIWDALLSDRPYRKAWKPDKVINHLKEISGKIVDPSILEVFLRMIKDNETETG